MSSYGVCRKCNQRSWDKIGQNCSFFSKSTVDGVIGVAIHRVPRAVVLEVKQRHESVLIPLQLLVDTAAPDHRRLQGTAIQTLAEPTVRIRKRNICYYSRA